MGALPIAIVKHWQGESHPADGWIGGLHEGIAARANRHHLPLAHFEFHEEADREKLQQESADAFSGVLFFSIYQKRYRPDIERAVERFRCPKVILDHHFDDIPMHSVREDSEAGMRALAGHLLELGHRHIAYLDRADPAANPWKRDGLNAALHEAGLPGMGRGWVAGCRDSFTDVSAALDWFLSLDPRPTAIIAFDDLRALLLLQAAAERGLRVPQDLSVAGYGDWAVHAGRSKVLTSVAADADQLGRRAAELAGGDPRAEPVAVLVAPRLAARGTTAGPPER